MMKTPADFINVLKRTPGSQRGPQLQVELTLKNGGAVMIRDWLPLSTWIALGALLQCALVAFLPLRLAVLPAALYLGSRLVLTGLQASSVLRNPYMDDVIRGKTSAQIPDPTTGKFGNVSAAQPVVVFLIGARFNHPLGMLSPGARELGVYFEQLSRELASPELREEYGLLGQSAWLGTDAPSTNHILSIMYFRDAAGLNRFAHAPLHREAWSWYSKTKHAHLGIMHETYCVPAGAWEAIYANFAPNLLGATRHLVPAEHPAAEKPSASDKDWVSPLCAANTGSLRSQIGRMPAPFSQTHQDADREMRKGMVEVTWDGQKVASDGLGV